jgi:glutamate-ammonia-ligase adenylyltransferase
MPNPFSKKNPPKELSAVVTDFISQLKQKLNPEQQSFIKKEEVQSSITQVCSCSQFIRDTCLRNPSVLVDLVQSTNLFSAHQREDYPNADELKNINNEASLMKQLRLFRNKEMVRIAWRDLAEWSDLDETLLDLTALAETCIQTALDFLYQEACKRRGTPTF